MTKPKPTTKQSDPRAEIRAEMLSLIDDLRKLARVARAGASGAPSIITKAGLGGRADAFRETSRMLIHALSEAGVALPNWHAYARQDRDWWAVIVYGPGGEKVGPHMVSSLAAIDADMAYHIEKATGQTAGRIIIHQEAPPAGLVTP